MRNLRARNVQEERIQRPSDMEEEGNGGEDSSYMLYGEKHSSNVAD